MHWPWRFLNHWLKTVVRSSVDGTEMFDRGEERNGKIIWGAIGFGTLKLAVHRASIEKLFESNDQVFDAEEIFALAKEMA